jgi:hypothetical protein
LISLRSIKAEEFKNIQGFNSCGITKSRTLELMASLLFKLQENSIIKKEKLAQANSNASSACGKKTKIQALFLELKFKKEVFFLRFIKSLKLQKKSLSRYITAATLDSWLDQFRLRFIFRNSTTSYQLTLIQATNRGR